MSLIVSNRFTWNILSDRYAGSVYVHWNFWCSVQDPVQRDFCRHANRDRAGGMVREMPRARSTLRDAAGCSCYRITTGLEVGSRRLQYAMRYHAGSSDDVMAFVAVSFSVRLGFRFPAIDEDHS